MSSERFSIYPFTIIAKVVWACILVVYGYLGTVELSDTVAASFNDLLAHGLGYILLVCVTAFAFPEERWSLKIVLGCFIYSIAIECVQYFLPYRSFSLLDILANGAGVLVGLLLVNLFWLVRRRICQ